MDVVYLLDAMPSFMKQFIISILLLVLAMILLNAPQPKRDIESISLLESEFKVSESKVKNHPPVTGDSDSVHHNPTTDKPVVEYSDLLHYETLEFPFSYFSDGYTMIENFCYKGEPNNFWKAFKIVQLSISFDPKHTKKEDFKFFVAGSVSESVGKFEKSIAETSKFTDWMASNLVERPLTFLFVSSNSDSPFYDFWFSSPLKIRLDPFSPSCVTIATDKPYTASLVQTHLSPWLLSTTLIGIVLFTTAPFLASEVLFYYASCSMFAVVAFLILFLYITIRLMPGRKPLITILGCLGTSAAFVLSQKFWVSLLGRTLELALEYKTLCTISLTVSAISGFFIAYWIGPPAPRSQDVIRWFLRVIGAFFIFVSCQNLGVVALILLGCLSFDNRQYLRQGAIKLFNRSRPFVYRIYPKSPPMVKKLLEYIYPNVFTRRYLSLEEYEAEGQTETKRQLTALRNYVNSPQVNHWELTQRLGPGRDRFIHFASPNSNVESFMTDFPPDDSDTNDIMDNSDEEEIMKQPIDIDYISDDDD